MSEEWDLLDSMHIRNFSEAERAVASGVPQAPAARSEVLTPASCADMCLTGLACAHSSLLV
jgi:hypothetical protein